MSSDSVPHDSNAWGTIALTTPANNTDYTITYRTQFSPKGWNDNLTDMWDDFSDDGKFKDIQFDQKVNDPRAALSVKFKLAPNETKEIEFFLTWDFPNRKDWNDKVIIGNYYSTFYENAWDVAEKTLPLLPSLEAKTIDFVNLMVKSDFPSVMKEAALFNSSTLVPKQRSEIRKDIFSDGKAYLRLRVPVMETAPMYGITNNQHHSCSEISP